MSSSSIIPIQDIRTQKEFSGITFSGYKKTDVIKKCIQTILYSKIEDAMYWCIELMCAGHFIDIWDTIFKVMSTHIHIANPKLPIYIHTRCDDFKLIVNNGYIDKELELRNNEKIRKLFMEIMVILCSSTKRNAITQVKLNEDALELSEFGRFLKADHTNYNKSFFYKDDPKEIFIPMNEFSYNLKKRYASCHTACYWLEWIYHFDSVCKKKKTSIVCKTRDYVSQHKLNNDILWIIWDAILYESKNREPIVNKIIQSLCYIYCLKFSLGMRKKRKHLFYYAIFILCENINYSLPITEYDIIPEFIKKSETLFKKIKKNEKRPRMDYLYHNITDNEGSIEKSAKRLETMNSVNILPRNNV